MQEPATPDPTVSPTRSLAKTLIRLSLFVFIAVVITKAIGSRPRSSDQQTIKSLVEYVTANGQVTSLHPRLANVFGIPVGVEVLRFRSITVKLEQGQPAVAYDESHPPPEGPWSGGKSAQVRSRPGTDRVDVVLVDATNEAEAFYFLTSDNGALDQAVRFDTAPHALDDASTRFASEIDFWGKWLDQTGANEIKQ